MRLYSVPTDATKVRQFLGLASYYRKFIPGFAKIAGPLHVLTKRDVVIHWTTECEAAFQGLKDCLVSAPVLAFPRFGPGEEFILETDASGVSLGAVLAQEQDGQIHPIAYASRTLDPHEKNYGISELETLGLVWAVKYFVLIYWDIKQQFILIMLHALPCSTLHALQESLLGGHLPFKK
jgi:hypothetical protein